MFAYSIYLVARRGGLSLTSFHGNPSRDVANIIRRNPDLKTLHLSLDTRRRTHGEDIHSETRQKALEYNGYAVSRLKTLSLEGILHFIDKAWTTWATTFVWETLQTLWIIGTPLS